MDLSNPLLPLALAQSLQRCWCGEKTCAFGMRVSEAPEGERVRLLGLCWTCACIVRMSPLATPPRFYVVG
jgi:hypothetical protein